MTSRLFHISDVLTVTTGRLLSTRGIDGLYDILNFMTDDNLFTHQLPRAGDECAPYLLRQYPILNDLDTQKLDSMLPGTKTSNSEDEIRAIIGNWIKEECERLGIPEMLDIDQIPSDAHQVRDPIVEAIEMREKKD